LPPSCALAALSYAIAAPSCSHCVPVLDPDAASLAVTSWIQAPAAGFTQRTPRYLEKGGMPCSLSAGKLSFTFLPWCILAALSYALAASSSLSMAKFPRCCVVEGRRSGAALVAPNSLGAAGADSQDGWQSEPRRQAPVGVFRCTRDWG
jgi:hypothetical protein